VDLNDQRAKPHRDVRMGDRIAVTRSNGRRQLIEVSELAERHLPKTEARRLYRDVTPPPTPEEEALADLLRMTAPRGPKVAPGRRERRLLRRLKDDWGQEP